MESVFGINNTFDNYISVLAIYFLIYLIVRWTCGTIPTDFKKTFWALYIGWALGTFFGNYAFHKLEIMSFIPWFNNFIHTFIWIGVCLGSMYAGIYKKSIWIQIALFIILSYIIKMAEFFLLNSWEMNNFFGISGKWSYIIGWSIMDGLYPFISIFCLRLASKFVKGLIVPKIKWS